MSIKRRNGIVCLTLFILPLFFAAFSSAQETSIQEYIAESLRALPEGEIEKQGKALIELAESGGAEAEESFADIAQDKHAPVLLRGLALALLGKMQSKKTTGLARSIIKDNTQNNIEQRTLRFAVILALGLARADESFEVLSLLLGDEDKEIRKLLYEIIKSAGKGAAKPLAKGLKKTLKHGSIEAKKDALDFLAGADVPDKADIAYPALKDNEPTVRFKAAIILADMKDPRGINALKEAFESKDNGDRESAKKALVKIGSPAAKHLAQLADNPDVKVRADVAWILHDIGGTDGFDILLKMKEDPNERVHIAAWDGLIKIGRTYPFHIMRLLESNIVREKKSGLWLVKDIGYDPALKYALKLADDPDKDVRIAAVGALGAIKDPAAAAKLVSLLRSKDDDLKEKAASSLRYHNLNDPALIDQLLEVLNDKDYKVRIVAGRALASFNDDRLVEPLAVLLNDNIPYVRSEISDRLLKISRPDVFVAALQRAGSADVRLDTAMALVSLNDVRGIKPLIEAAAHFRVKKASNEYLRKRVIEALTKIRNPQTILYLKEVISEGDKDMRLFTIEILKSRKDPDTIPLILSALNDKDITVRKSAVRCLAMITTVLDVHPLIKLLAEELAAHQNNSYQYERQELISSIIDLLGRTRDVGSTGVLINALAFDSQIKEPAETALYRLGPSATEPLLRVLSNGNDTMKERAAAVLVRIKDPRSEDIFIQLASNNSVRMRLHAIGGLKGIKNKRTYQAIVDTLQDKDDAVRAASAMALSEISGYNDTEAIKPLLTALNDKIFVRQFAAIALARITGRDFGSGRQKWENWWMSNEEIFMELEK